MDLRVQIVCLAPERRYGGKGSRNRLPGQAVSARTGRPAAAMTGRLRRNDGARMTSALRAQGRDEALRRFAGSLVQTVDEVVRPIDGFVKRTRDAMADVGHFRASCVKFFRFSDTTVPILGNFRQESGAAPRRGR